MAQEKEPPGLDPKVQRRRKSYDKRLELERKEDVKTVMSTPAGRRFVFNEIFIDGHLMDVYLTADSGIYRHEGQRAKSAKLAKELQENHPEDYLLMVTERLKSQSTDKRIREDIDRGDDPDA
jgi:hypothetical protein